MIVGAAMTARLASGSIVPSNLTALEHRCAPYGDDMMSAFTAFNIVGGGTKRHRSGAGKKSTCLEKFGFCDEWLAARRGIKKYSKGAH